MHLPTLITIILNYGASRASDGLSGCGLCDKTSFCNSGGQCCTVQEDSYQKWSDGTARHRYSCTITKLIRKGEQTNYLNPIDVFDGTYLQNVWMISECPTRYSNQTVKQLCESPGIYEDIENVAPVSDSVVNFRNKFCAYCNSGWNDSVQLTYWFAELYCDADLSSSTNVLAAIVRRMCNLFFRPPHNVPVEECLVKQETLESCRITLQRSHNTNISFQSRYPHTDVIDRKTCDIDPNPKHHLCYDCDEAYQWNITENFCPTQKDAQFSLQMAPFTDMLEVTAIITPPKDISSDNCDSSLQFYDRNNMMCRELRCGEDRYLWKGDCVMARNMEIYCTRVLCNYRFLFFVKLIPVTVNKQTGLTADDINKELPNELYQFFRQIVIEADPLTEIPDSVIESFRIYKKSAPTLSHMFGEYLIVQLIVKAQNFTVDFLTYMFTKIHNTMLFTFHEISFSSEFVYYDLVYFHDANDGWQFDLKIGSSSENFLEQIPFDITLFDANSEWLIFKVFRKLSICPYIELESQEFSVQIENDGSLILGNTVMTARFSPWEFELENYEMFNRTDVISLCASDYETRLNSPSDLGTKPTIAENNTSFELMKIQFGWFVGLATACILII